MKTEKILAVAGLVLALAAVNLLIIQKQSIHDRGQTVLVELGAADPRSLIQGDYMQLRYRIPNQFRKDIPDQGFLVYTLDENRVATILRFHGDEPLAPGEQLLFFRYRDHQVMPNSGSYFFQEGAADEYRGARYAVLKVAEDGKSVLAGLRDAERQPLPKKALAEN